MWVTGWCKVVTPDMSYVHRNEDLHICCPILCDSLLFEGATFEPRPKWWEGASSSDNLDIKHSRDKRQLVQRCWGRHEFGAKVHGSVCLDFREWERDGDWTIGKSSGQKSYRTGQWLSATTAYKKCRYFTPREYEAVSLGWGIRAAVPALVILASPNDSDHKWKSLV